METCKREGCNEPLGTGKVYCSPKCSANRNKPKIELSSAVIPREIEDMVRSSTGEYAGVVLRQMEAVLGGKEITAPEPNLVSTHGDWVLSYSGDREYRPNSPVTYDTIYDMERSGVVSFAKEMKASGILSAFKSPLTRVLVTPDIQLRDAITASLEDFLFLGMSEAVDSFLAYGISVQEIEWANKTGYELGLSNSRSAGRTWTVINSLKSVNPSTVDSLLRKNGKFNGFVQKAPVFGVKDVVVKVENSLVMSYNEKFRNKWGISMYELIYPYWFWYQIVLRAMVRYMERMGTPVAVVKGPSTYNVLKPGTTERVNALVWAQQIASLIGMSSAIALPSETDPETGKPMWEASYLTSDERSEPFISVLESLTQMILRCAILGDRAVSKDSGSTGSSAMAEVHLETTRIHDDKIVAHMLATMNDNIFPRIARYNRGLSAPPLKMAVKGLSMRDRDMIMRLFAVAGNSPAAQDALARVNYERMAIDGGIAYLDKDEFEKQQAEIDKRSLDRQRKNAEMQHELAKKYSDGDPLDKQADKDVPKVDKKLGRDELEDTIIALVTGKKFPIFLSEDEFDIDNGVILLKGKKFRESDVKRDNRGRFGGSKGGGTVKGPTGGKSSIASKVVKAGAIGGIAGGIVIGTAIASEENRRNAESIDANIGDWPKPKSTDEAMSAVKSVLEDNGIEVHEGIEISTDMSKSSNPDLQFPHFDPRQGVIFIPEAFAEQVSSGDTADPSSMAVLMHEMAHSAQMIEGSNHPDGIEIPNPETVTDADIDSLVGTFEGQNQLVTMMSMSSLYKTPIQGEDLTALSVASMMANGADPGSTMRSAVDPYMAETEAWAGVAGKWEKETGQDAAEFVSESHGNGFSISSNRSILMRLFPEQMRDFNGENQLPSPSTVSGWLEAEGIDGRNELERLTEGASKK